MGLSMSRYGDGPIDFGPADDDYRSYDMRGEETARGPLILALAAGVLIVFGAVVWNTYRQGVRSESGSLPLITAQADPYKVVPDDAGGRVIPDQELRFYDEIDGSTRQTVTPVEGLRRSVSAGPSEALAGGGADDSFPAPATGDLEPLTAGSGADVDSAIGAPRRSILDDDAPRIAALDEATMALGAEQAARLDRVTSSALRELGARSPQFNFTTSGAYMVQIAALRESARAEATWDAISTRHPDIFAGAEKRIQRADLGSRGIFYRLRAGAFETRADAGAFCEAIKSSGNDCIIVQ